MWLRFTTGDAVRGLGPDGGSAATDLLDVDPAAPGQAREQHQLVGGIEALDIADRIGLGVAAGLCLREDVGILTRVRSHGAEDVVGGAVQDAPDGMHLAGSEFAHQRTEHRYARQDRGLEAQRGTGRTCRVLELPAAAGQQVLVGCDHVLVRRERGEDRLARHTRAADELDDDIDLVVENLAVVRHLAHIVGDGQAAVALEVEIGDRDERWDRLPARSHLRRPGGVQQSPGHRRAHRAQAEQGHARTGALGFGRPDRSQLSSSQEHHDPWPDRSAAHAC